MIETFEDGTPAVVVSSYGKGETVVFNFEAGRLLFPPGNGLLEQMVSFHTLGLLRPPFEVKGPETMLAYRRAAPEADHYFLINEGGEAEVHLSSGVISYSTGKDLLNGTVLDVEADGIRVTVPARSGSWIRLEKSKDH